MRQYLNIIFLCKKRTIKVSKPCAKQNVKERARIQYILYKNFIARNLNCCIHKLSFYKNTRAKLVFDICILAKYRQTYSVYCYKTPLTSLPLSATSRMILLANLTSSSVSTKIFMLHISRISGICNTKIPSIIITSAGYIYQESFYIRECVAKSYIGIFTALKIMLFQLFI